MKLRHLITSTASTLLLTAAAMAQPKISALSAETRMGWHQEAREGTILDPESGFKGRYLNFFISGDLSDDISFIYRQRLNKMHSSSSFFDATDYLYINWNTGNYTFSAGKQVVNIGGYEYDREPINLYLCSEFWNNIACYQFGISATRHFEKDAISAQICQSPTGGPASNLYAYNLMWNGSHGIWSSIWSANMVECTKGSFINYIALGNRFDIGKFRLELDLMNRASDMHEFFLKDWSVMAEASYRPTGRTNFFIKATHDHHDAHANGDICVTPGTKITMGGAGFEYKPLNDINSLKIYGYAGESFGTATNVDAAWSNHHVEAEIGIKVGLDILKSRK